MTFIAGIFGALLNSLIPILIQLIIEVLLGGASSAT